MIRASYHDKQVAVHILSKAYKGNLGPNLIIKQDEKVAYRLIKLMEYIFEMCHLFGDIFISDDQSACACFLYPDKKKITFRSIYLAIKLIFQCVGLKKLKEVLKNETIRQKIRPKKPYSYLWVIGVDPMHQQKGSGSSLIQALEAYSFSKQRPLYLEAVIPQNVQWYQKLGFEVYHQEELTCKVHFLKKELSE